MEILTQSIGDISPLLKGLSKEDVMKFLFHQNNNNWRKRNGYPMKRKGLNKRKKRKSYYFAVDESHLCIKTFIVMQDLEQIKNAYQE